MDEDEIWRRIYLVVEKTRTIIFANEKISIGHEIYKNIFILTDITL